MDSYYERFSKGESDQGLSMLQGDYEVKKVFFRISIYILAINSYKSSICFAVVEIFISSLFQLGALGWKHLHKNNKLFLK